MRGRWPANITLTFGIITMSITRRFSRPLGGMSRVALALALALGTHAASAQETSSSMRGKIFGPDGAPAANTKITLIHSPSGTVREITANDAGVFLAKGLRVGGPYTVIIDSDVYRDKVEEGISLKLGETYRLIVELDDPNADMERIVVTGSAPAFTSSGGSSSFGELDIARAPSFNRDLKDIVRSNPLATVDDDGGLSVGGSNPRFNSITVDGIGQNDDFGLNVGGYPTQRSPISLDAISQVSIDSSPFTAKVGGFSGGLVNAVTKSGTNEFSGSVFYEITNEDLAADPEDSRASEPRAPGDTVDRTGDSYEVGEERTFGFTLGGPIIKDKAFFFFSYEDFDKDAPAPFGVGAGSNPSDITEATFNSFNSTLANVYGITDTLSGDEEDTDRKVLLKLDWNINDYHRADLTFQWQNNEEGRNFTEDVDEIKMQSNAYTLKTLSSNFAAHLYSDWNDDFSTEISMSYKDVQINSNTNSQLGEVTVQVENIEDDNDRGGDIVFGVDAFRHANLAETSTFKLNLDANYLWGDHDIKFGYQMERLRLYNLFAESSKGVWSFDSLDDFANVLPSEFVYKNAFTNVAADTEYELVRYTHAVYAEDTFAVNDDFELTLAMRYERLASDDEPAQNDNFFETYGFYNTENLDGLDIFLPRIGFKWYLNENMILRGGAGKYSGGKPNVWVANSFTNDGITFVAAPESVTQQFIDDVAALDTVTDRLTQVNFGSVPTVVSSELSQGAGSTNYVDPGYRMAYDWRVQLALDWTLDIPYLGEAFSWINEINYVKKKHAPFWVDTAREDSNKRTSDGGRVVYESIYTGDLADNYDIKLTNVDDGGRNIIFTTALQKSWDNGVRMNLSYTHQDITEANPGTSSRAVSNYQFNVTLNRNDPLVDTAYYEIEHALKLDLGYTTEFFDGYETNFTLYFSRRSGRPLTWTLGAFRDDDLGDQSDLDDSDVYLPYIPTGVDDPNVTYAGNYTDANGDSVPFDYARALELIQAAGLEGYAGGYVDKNDTTQPWITTMDLSISQEVPGFLEGHKGIITLTIDNLANLLNDDWGQVYRMRFPQQILFDYDIDSDTRQYIYREPFGGADTRNWDEFVSQDSTWRIKLGVRYRF